MKRSLSVCLALAAAALLARAPDSRAETVLTLSSWMPPGHANVAGGIMPWAADVEKATDGRVKGRVLPAPLGKPAAHFDMAANGIADITYGVQGYQPGRFLTAEAVELPFLGATAEVMSVAYWRIFKKYLEQVGEYKDVQVLGVYTHGPGQIFNNVRPIKTIDDLQSVKIRIGGGVVNETAKALGMQVIHKPADEVFSLLSSGVIEGVAFPKETVKSYNLSKYIDYATIVPGGFYNVSWFLVMNKSKFESLSADDQAAIMRVSGETFARRVGKAWDDADASAIDFMQAQGIEVDTVSPEFVAQMKAMTDTVETDWYADVAPLGLDGRQVMTDLRAEIDRLQAGQ